MADNGKKKNIEKLIYNHERRLQKLKEQEALQGRDFAYTHRLEIEDIENKLRELNQELEALDTNAVQYCISALQAQTRIRECYLIHQNEGFKNSPKK